MADDVTRRLETYRAAVRDEFAFMKAAANIEELTARAIPLADGAGMLVPVAELHSADSRLIAMLASWRAQSSFAFPTRFPVTHDGTATWLRRGVLDVPDRILFLVHDRFGHPVGHVGFASADSPDRSLEVDNVVRGEAGVQPGLMGAALEGLLAWAADCFRPARIHLRVFADNERAVAFYRRHGFRDGARQPLRREVEGKVVRYTPTSGERADAWFLGMEWTPERADGDAPILTAGPSISPREVAYTTDAARHGWNSRWSGYISRFEREFAEYVGAEHAIATSSCTGALHMAMLAIGLGPGDEAIVPEQTWVATAKAVSYVGATPVFADVEPGSWCLDAASVESAVTERTKAIVPVHLYGHPADMDALQAVADRHGLPLIEDAAPAIGAEIRGRRVGVLGTAGAFSFQGAKLLVTGEGGMFVTNDPDMYARAYKAWDLGVDRSRGFWIDAHGLKYKLPNVAAAIGLAQLERVDHLIEAKREIFGWYSEELAGVAGITLNHETEWARSIYWMTSILVDPACGIDRDGMRAALAAEGIDTRPTFPLISTYPIWDERRAVPAPVAARIADRGINLPSGVRLRRDQVARIGEAVRRAASAGLRRAA
ncbi:MAG TPA: GNAT family N-acetyltransferase [Gaiellales bacterium]|nr:GNAT family N-acetyltransferase [Gaiellales bacterium]